MHGVIGVLCIETVRWEVCLTRSTVGMVDDEAMCTESAICMICSEKHIKDEDEVLAPRVTEVSIVFSA